MPYALFNLFDNGIDAVVTQKDAAEKWRQVAPEFHTVIKVKRGDPSIRGRKLDDLIEYANACMRDVTLAGGD